MIPLQINTLDSKISVELTSLNDKIRSMNEEMKEFDNIGQLKVKSEATKRVRCGDTSGAVRGVVGCGVEDSLCWYRARKHRS